jgi:isoleucyl-tRNA synthetase
LKDITNRYKLLRGFQINYLPGWDCHGLPIELKSSKLGKGGVLTDPLQIREAARKIVDQSISSHKQAFKRWGILAEWASPYKTLDKTYIKTQLQMFLELYEKGLVFRDFKPVFWSPSSKYDQ